MNREIKFRAWDKVNKRWVGNKSTEILCVGDDAGMIVHYKAVGGSYIPVQNIQLKNSSLEILEICQYTGLKDRNGKEIYEGDVVRLTYWEYEKGWYSKTPIEAGAVYFDTYWGVKFDCRDATQRTAEYWKNVNERDLGNMPNLQEERDIEIIGNIYENPDLIK